MPFSPKRAGSVLYSMVMFIVVSVLAGLLIAGLVVPFAGLAGASSRAAADELKNVPADLQTPPQSQRSKVLDANGKVLAYFYDENRIYVPLDKIAPVMRQAQIAVEDSRFYEHGPLDIQGTLRAFLRNQTSDVTQGGSSITQQYVKMVQIEKAVAAGDEAGVKAAQETTYARKIQELRYAIALEQKLSKDQILERYLNIAYYGEGAYGVEAAAQHYFSVSADQLNLAQAAMLAGLVQNPDNGNPVENEQAALDRRDFVLNRMVELKMITPAAATAAKKVGFDKDKVKPTKNGCVNTKYPFLCDYVRRSLLNTPSLGDTPEERQNMLNRGGLTIQTKIDPKLQDKAQKAVSNYVDPRDPIISVMTEVEPGTGLILAMAQSRPVMGSNVKKGETWYNYAVSADMGGGEGYQAGSTFKAFTAAAALEKGIPLTKKFNAQRTMKFGGKKYDTCDGEKTIFPTDWKVSNSTGTNGIMDMYRGAARSVNTYFVQLELATGMCNVTKMAKKVGVQLSNPDLDIVDYYQDKPSFTLGTAEVTPLSMADAYATFAAGGIHCDPIIISKITNEAGKELAAPSANCERVISKDVAAGVTSMLQGVMGPGGTGSMASIPGVKYQAGKTGTIDDAQAVWFVGYTQQVAGASMLAIDRTKAPFKKGSKHYREGLKGFRMPYSDNYLGGSGGGDAGREVWKPAMTAAMKGKPDEKFDKPSDEIVHGKKVSMPSLTGLTISQAIKKLEKAGFTVVTRHVYSDRPKGTFLGFSPSGGRVPEFSTIYAQYSDGEDPKVTKEKKEKAKAEQEQQQKAEEQAKKQQEQAQQNQQNQSHGPSGPPGRSGDH